MFGFLKNAELKFQSSNRLARIWYLRKLYSKMSLKLLRRYGIKNILINQFPYSFRDALTVPSLTVEFTNLCNLKCPYCSSPYRIRKGGIMTMGTFEKLVSEIRKNKVKRIRIVGNGEPTIHPRFNYMISEIKKAAPVVSLTTNAQFIKPDIVQGIIDSKVDMVNISVDSMFEEEYKKRRPGGDFEKLVNNIRELKEMKDSNFPGAIINIRIMLTPSDLPVKNDISAFWKPYGDIVSYQYISNIQHENQKSAFADQFHTDSKKGYYPRCSIPFKLLDVHWNGDIPICTYSEMQLGRPGGMVLGNINTHTLNEIWNNPVIKQYRDAHRARMESAMPMCNGCQGT